MVDSEKTAQQSAEESRTFFSGLSEKKAFWISASGLWFAGLIAAGVFVAADIAYNRLAVPPLDDTYIHFQYAKQIARGFFFRYFDGDPVSTGATSFIYPILLAPFWRLGLRGTSLIWAAHFLNFLGLMASMTFVYATLRRVLQRDNLFAWLGGLLVGMNGWYLWGVTSGMAIGITSCALAGVLYSLTLYIQEGRRWPLAVAVAFLSASRPEGLVMSYAVFFFLWLYEVFRPELLSSPRKEKDTSGEGAVERKKAAGEKGKIEEDLGEGEEEKKKVAQREGEIKREARGEEEQTKEAKKKEVRGKESGEGESSQPASAAGAGFLGVIKSWVLIGWRGAVSMGWPLWVGLGVGTLPTFIMMAASGHTTTNGMLVKSHFAIDMDWVRYIWETGRTIAAVPGRLLWAPSSVFHGLMSIAVLLGIASLLSGKLRDREGRRNSAFGMAVVGAFVSILAFYGFLMEHIEHHNRYYMPYQPLVVLTLVIGLDTLSGLFKEKLRPAVRRSALALLLILGFGSVGEWSRIYAHNCSDIAGTYLPMSKWMRENIPEDVSVAVHDAGALPYLGGRKCHDIIGLVSNEFRVPGGGRSDAVAWEGMERLRPGFMIIYPRFFPQLSRLPVFKKVHSVRIPRVTIAGGPEKVAYEILWDKLSPASRPQGASAKDEQQWSLVDVIDPGDIVNEKEHSYEVHHGRVRGAARFRLHVFRIHGGYLIDGARVYSDEETFSVGPLDTSRSLLLGVRTVLNEKVRLKVSIDGKPLEGYWDLGRTYDRSTSEAYLEIAAHRLKSKRPKITIEPLDGKNFSAFHYFALQPK